MIEEEDAYLNSPVCVGCGIHPEEDEEHEEGCPQGEQPRCPVHLAGTQPSPIQCGFAPHKGGQHAGLNDAGGVVWFPADPVVEAPKEWRVAWTHLGVKDHGHSLFTCESSARRFGDRLPHLSLGYTEITIQFRAAPGPWQDS